MQGGHCTVQEFAAAELESRKTDRRHRAAASDGEEGTTDSRHKRILRLATAEQLCELLTLTSGGKACMIAAGAAPASALGLPPFLLLADMDNGQAQVASVTLRLFDDESPDDYYSQIGQLSEDKTQYPFPQMHSGTTQEVEAAELFGYAATELQAVQPPPPGKTAVVLCRRSCNDEHGLAGFCRQYTSDSDLLALCNVVYGVTVDRRATPFARRQFLVRRSRPCDLFTPERHGQAESKLRLLHDIISHFCTDCGQLRSRTFCRWSEPTRRRRSRARWPSLTT